MRSEKNGRRLFRSDIRYSDFEDDDEDEGVAGNLLPVPDGPIRRRSVCSTKELTGQASIPRRKSSLAEWLLPSTRKMSDPTKLQKVVIPL